MHPNGALNQNSNSQTKSKWRRGRNKRWGDGPPWIRWRAEIFFCCWWNLREEKRSKWCGEGDWLGEDWKSGIWGRRHTMKESDVDRPEEEEGGQRQQQRSTCRHVPLSSAPSPSPLRYSRARLGLFPTLYQYVVHVTCNAPPCRGW